MLKELIEITRRAGKETLTFYEDEVEVEMKDDDSPVTRADLAAHNVILGELSTLTPEIPIVSEEGSYLPDREDEPASSEVGQSSTADPDIPSYEIRKDWERFWIVDPLDGTKEFIKKNGEFTVNIALIEDGKPIMGVVYAPAEELLYYASRGKGSFKQKGDGAAERLRSVPADRSRPLVLAQSRSHSSDELENWIEEQGITLKDRIRAGSSLKFGLVAEGKADLYVRMGPTMEWDVAAGDAVFRYSGKNGERHSPLTYNKKSLKNEGFVIGLEQ